MRFRMLKSSTGVVWSFRFRSLWTGISFVTIFISESIMTNRTNHDETEMIRAAADGDRSAAGALWERYRKLMYIMAQDRPTDDWTSGGVTSEIVAEASQQYGKASFFEGVNDREHFKNKLRLVIRGKAVDRFRRESIRQTHQLPDDSVELGSELDPAFLIAESEDLLKKLPVDDYNLLQDYLDNGSERATAELIGITRDRLHARLVEIARKIQSLLGEAEDDDR